MAHRPAPIQISFLGLPTTTGATFIDYYLSDWIAVPSEHVSHFSEKLILLPPSYIVNDYAQVQGEVINHNNYNNMRADRSYIAPNITVNSKNNNNNINGNNKYSNDNVSKKKKTSDNKKITTKKDIENDIENEIQNNFLAQSTENSIAENLVENLTTEDFDEFQTTDQTDDTNKLVKKTGMVERKSAVRAFRATAYCLKGRMANGGGVRRGVVAADPRVLRLGTKIYLNAGPYSGTYTVSDTGGAIKGNILDVWVPSCSEANRFGRRTVTVSIIN